MKVVVTHDAGINPLPHGRGPINPTVFALPIAQKVLNLDKIIKLLCSYNSSLSII
jgi:hypothetical protein